MNVTVICGGAGTGKTEHISNDIKSLLKKSPLVQIAVLAPTHSALANIKRRIGSSSSITFATIFSYFRINWESDHVIGAIKYHQYIYIDEFGLIRKELFASILDKISGACKFQQRDIHVIISGDIAQLSPIYLEDRSIKFSELKTYYESVPAHIVEHDYNSIFSLPEIRAANKIKLTHNYRSNANIYQLIYKLFYERDCSVIKTITTMKAFSLLDEGYTFLSSRYDDQFAIYNLWTVQMQKREPEAFLATVSSPFKQLLFYKGAKFLVAETNASHNNGDVITFSRTNKDDYFFIDEEENEFTLENTKIVPLQMLTVHKAQGLSLEKVIVCLDELFDPCMLYTACTRAVSSLLFYSKNGLGVEFLKRYLESFYSLLKYYGYIVDELD